MQSNIDALQRALGEVCDVIVTEKTVFHMQDKPKIPKKMCQQSVIGRCGYKRYASHVKIEHKHIRDFGEEFALPLKNFCCVGSGLEMKIPLLLLTVDIK